MPYMPFFPAEKLVETAMILLTKNCLDSSLACIQKALLLDPNNRKYLYLLGNVLWSSKRFDEARIVLEKANFTEDVGFFDTIANVYTNLCEFDLAHKYFEQGIGMDDENKFDVLRVNYSLSLLYSGKWLEGWKHYEARKNQQPMNYFEPVEYKPWRGERAKSVFIYSEQGIGDIIMWARYLPWVASLADQVYFNIAPELVCLFDNYPGVTRLGILKPTRDWKPGAKEQDLFRGDWPPAEYIVALGSLPLCHNTTPYNVPPDPGHFRRLAEKEQFGELPDLPPKEYQSLKIGVCWSGNPTHSRDQERSVPIEYLLPLAATPSVTMYALQVGQRASDISLAGAQPLINFSLIELMNNWLVTAKILLQMDLVITVDTAIAHMAGALGVDTWLLIPSTPDWRWGSTGNTNPWYRSITLFRAETANNWQSALTKVRTALNRKLVTKGLPRLFTMK